LPTEYPAHDGWTTNALIPPEPGPPVRAIATTTFAVPLFVTHAFEPFSVQPWRLAPRGSERGRIHRMGLRKREGAEETASAIGFR
jgi:hypothetical protein